MRLSVFAYSRRGCMTARKVAELFDGEKCQKFTMEKFGETDFMPMKTPSRDFYGELFHNSDALIFISSCGIALRQIAPFVKDKRTDPAVICIDELGTFVIPILSGHIGGANALAAGIAGRLGSTAVITTATDINGRFSVDAWAAANGFSISDMKLAKAVSAKILEEDIPILSRFPVKTHFPAGTVEKDSGALGILLSWKLEAPFTRTLRLIPKVLHLGIGCRKGISKEAVAFAVEQVLHTFQIDPSAIRCAASIDLKAQEQGLLAYLQEQKIPVTFYTARELNDVPGSFTPSSFVSSITGVDNVCERAAMIGADQIIVKKTACNGVTVAVAQEYREVYFG